jgi:DNA ligase (NAD+)
LRAAGVKLEEKAVKPKELLLAGQEVVITGTLNRFTREEAESRIKALGGMTRDNVTRKTNYVVVGANPGSKLARAQELNIKQIDEEEFLRLLEKAT